MKFRRLTLAFNPMYASLDWVELFGGVPLILLVITSLAGTRLIGTWWLGPGQKQFGKCPPQ
jgi:hypothetical protein